MDHDLGWWVRVVLERWRLRDGPQYRRIAAAIATAVDRGAVTAGDRVPAERPLADALGVSRGTVVRAVAELTSAGLVERRQGAGTFVRGRPAWTDTPTQYSSSALLQRWMADRHDIVDLSLSVPAGIEHLPAIDTDRLLAGAAGHGIHPAGTLELRAAIGDYLTRHLGLPTTADQLVVTAGARQALFLLAATVLGPSGTVITGCPTNPGLAGTLAGSHARLIGVPVDALGLDSQAVTRLAARISTPTLYVDPTGHDPTGAVLSPSRRESLLNTARRGDVFIVEDLTQAGLILHPTAEPVIPLAAGHPSVLALGSLSKMFWAGLRIGWIRGPSPVLARLLRLRATVDLAPSVPAQILASRLLSAVSAGWLHDLGLTLRSRRDLLLSQLNAQLPAWQTEPPAAGLSIWVRLPVNDSETFAHVASRYRVIVAPGATCCIDGRHHAGIRLSIAESPETLVSAVDRLAAAWERHSQELAAGPSTRPLRSRAGPDGAA